MLHNYKSNPPWREKHWSPAHLKFSSLQDSIKSAHNLNTIFKQKCFYHLKVWASKISVITPSDLFFCFSLAHAPLGVRVRHLLDKALLSPFRPL